MSNSVWPHRWQPTRLPCPWDSPGKNSGVGCHFFLQCVKVKSESEVAQSCLTRSDPMDCSLPGSSVHGIFQARVLEWGAIAFSVSDTRDLFFAFVLALYVLSELCRNTWRISSLLILSSYLIFDILRRPYKQQRKEKLKAKEKRRYIPIWMQSSKE